MQILHVWHLYSVIQFFWQKLNHSPESGNWFWAPSQNGMMVLSASPTSDVLVGCRLPPDCRRGGKRLEVGLARDTFRLGFSKGYRRLIERLRYVYATTTLRLCYAYATIAELGCRDSRAPLQNKIKRPVSNLSLS